MRKQDYLLQLIQSLNMSERRYFKLYCSLQSGEKKFLQLYDQLEGKTEYNASEVCKAMGVTTGQLAKLKQYLSQELLRSLRNYSEPEIIALYNTRTDVRELMKRRLYDYALEIAEKSIARAWELEQFELLLALLESKYGCDFNLGRTHEMRKIADDRQKISAIISEAAEIDFLDNQSQRIAEKEYPSEDFKKLLQNRMLKSKPEKLLSLRAKAGWFRAVDRAYRHLEPGGKNSLCIARQQKLLYENNPSLKVFYAYAYINSYVSLAEAEAEAQNLTGASDIYDELIEKMDKGEILGGKIRMASIKAYLHVSKMYIFSKLDQFEKVLTEDKKLQPLIAQRSAYEQLDAALVLAIAHIHLQQDGTALDKLNEMLGIDTAERAEHLKTARPLLMMAHVGLGNYQLVPYLVKSAKAWMKRNKYADAEYDTFFNMIAAVANPPKNSSRRKAYANLMQSVKEGKLKQLAEAVYLERWVKNKMTISIA